VNALWQDLLGLVRDVFALADGEARGNGRRLVEAIFWILLGALVLLGSWLMVLAAGILLLIQAGMSPAVALLLGALLNLGVGVLALRQGRTTVAAIGWPATRRTFAAVPNVDADSPPAERAIAERRMRIAERVGQLQHKINRRLLPVAAGVGALAIAWRTLRGPAKARAAGTAAEDAPLSTSERVARVAGQLMQGLALAETLRPVVKAIRAWFRSQDSAPAPVETPPGPAPGEPE
jgi:hypothetical protein